MNAPIHLPPKIDPFRYGWRYVKKKLPDGTVTLEEVPLTLEDVLHPQEDDVIPENTIHEQERGDLARIFRIRMRDRFDKWIVLSDCIIDWNVPGVGNHSPDDTVIVDLDEVPQEGLGTFRFARWGGRCLLAVEIVSPHTRKNDAKIKLDHYHKVNVPLYIVIDQKKENGPRKLIGYQWQPDGFEVVPLDGDGRLLLADLGLLIGLKDNLTVCYDAETGEEIPGWAEETDRRQAAEKKARDEEQARRAAQKRVTKEKKARQAAEEKAAKEEKARRAAEEKMRQLEEELKRLRPE